MFTTLLLYNVRVYSCLYGMGLYIYEFCTLLQVTAIFEVLDNLLEVVNVESFDLLQDGGSQRVLDNVERYGLYVARVLQQGSKNRTGTNIGVCVCVCVHMRVHTCVCAHEYNVCVYICDRPHGNGA